MSTGIITTFAGSGSPGYSGDNGAATAAAFDNTWAVAVDASDNVYIVDSSNNRIRKVAIAPTTAPTSSPSTLSPTPSPRYEPISTLLKSLANYSPIASVQLRRLLQHCLRLNQAKCHHFNRQQ
jgi:hypothetical protein